MKRILLLCLCLSLLFALGCEKEPNSDNIGTNPSSDNVEIVVEDGLRRINGQKIDNIYLADGKLHYTFVNQTDLESGCGPYTVTVEKWVEGKWCYYPLLSGVAREVALILPAQHEHSTSRFVRPQAVTPGKYRLVEGYEIFGTDAYGGVRLVRSNEHVYWIGYFTITEEQAAEYPDLPDDLYYSAGSYQSKNLLLSISNVENEFYHSEFTLQNNGQKNLIIPGKSNDTVSPRDDLMQQNTETGYMARFTWSQPTPEKDIVLAPGESYTFPLCSNDTPTAKKRYDLENGYYRYKLTCYWEGDTDNVFSALVFFTVTDNVIT